MAKQSNGIEKGHRRPTNRKTGEIELSVGHEIKHALEFGLALVMVASSPIDRFANPARSSICNHAIKLRFKLCNYFALVDGMAFDLWALRIVGPL